MKKQGTNLQLQADEEELEEDQYSNDGFELPSPKKPEHSTAANEINQQLSPSNTEYTTKHHGNSGAAMPVSPVQPKSGVIGNLEYGMRSKSPAIRIKGSSSQNVTKPPNKPNVDLQDVQEGGNKRSRVKKSLASSQQIKESNHLRRDSGGAQKGNSRSSKNQISSNNEVTGDQVQDLTIQRRATPPILQQAAIQKNFTRNSPKNQANGSTLPQVSTNKSMKEQYQTSNFNESRHSTKDPINIILPAKLNGNRQIKNAAETLNTSLSQLEQIEQLHDQAKIQQQDSLLQAAAKQNYPVTIPFKLPHQRQYGLKKQNFIKAPYQLSIKGGFAVNEDVGVKNLPLSTKNVEAEMPHIFMHKAKNSMSNSNSNTTNTHNGESSKQNHQLSVKDQKKEKISLVGRPYMAKTRLPFYDSRGVYQGVKAGGGSVNPETNKKYHEKLQQYETAYQQAQVVTYRQQNGIKKTRVLSSTQKQDQAQQISSGEVQQQENKNGPSPSIVSSPLGAVKQFATLQTKTDKNSSTRKKASGSMDLGQPEEEYQIDDKMRFIKRGQSDHSGASRGGAVRPPSLNNFKISKDQLRQSVETATGPSEFQATIFQSQRGLQYGFKIVQEVPFVESVQDNCKQVKNQQRSLQKLLTSSGLSKTGFQNMEGSQSSLNSQLQMVKQAEKIQSLQVNVEQLKEELRIKDRLVSKLLDEEDVADSGSMIQRHIRIASNQQVNAADKPNVVLKLKSELDLAYKILSQRDIEINSIKRQAKWQAFNQCNEERIIYMNECIKFQNLLKIYGGSQIRKQFKGVKIKQTTSHGLDIAQNRGSDTSIGVNNRSQARSPTANDEFQHLAMPTISEVSQSKKPLTSNQPSANMNLSTGFQLPETALVNAPQIEEFKKRIRQLEIMNEKLLEDKVEIDEEISQQAEFVNQLKREQLSLEQNLIEKANLAKSCQDINDDLNSEVDKLNSLNGSLQAEIENLKKDNAKALHSQNFSPKRNSINAEQLTEINKLRDQIETLKGDHSRISAEQLSQIDKLTAEIETFKSEYARISQEQFQETDRLRTEIETFKSDHARIVSEQLQEADKLISQIETLKEEAAIQAAKTVSQLAQQNEFNMQHDDDVKNDQSNLVKHLEQELEHMKTKEREYSSRLDSEAQQILDLTEKITLLDKQIKDEKTGLQEYRSQVDLKKEENAALIAQVHELRQQIHKVPEPPASLPAKDLNDLEFQNAELEQKVEELDKKVYNLTMQLEKAQNQQTVIENLQDKTNFANLISTQGNLVEQLESERRRTAELQQKVEQSELAANENSQANLTLDMDDGEIGQLEPDETLEQVQNDIKNAIEIVDQHRLRLLRVKERKLQTQEIKSLQEQFRAKNAIINSTLLSQELLMENQAKQTEQIAKLHAELEQANRVVEEKSVELEQAIADLANAQTKLNDLAENCLKLEADLAQLQNKNELTEIGLYEIVRTNMQEKFLVYKITNKSILKMMLSEQPQRVLCDQFMLPLKTQEVIDSSPAGLFNMVDVHKLVDISMIELEIGFRKMKVKLDEMNVSYKMLIFELESEEGTAEEEENKDPDEIRRTMADEALKAIPLMKEEFIYKVSSLVLKDQLLAEKIALGCQQVARSVCFVHYWAFNSLWVTFNSKESTGEAKVGMKTLLEQAAKEKQKNTALIAELERQKQEEAERAKIILQQAQEEARRREQEMADFVQNKQLEMAEKARLKEQMLIELAEKRDAELVEAARIRLEREQEIQKLQNLPADGENGDREGFSLGVYRYIKRNKDLGVIVDIANASLYSIRNQCSVFIIDGHRLSDGRRRADQDSEEDRPFISLSTARDALGRPVLDLSRTANEEEVIQQIDFYEQALRGMGLKKYIDIQEEHAKLDDCLYQIGALVTDSNSLSQVKLIRLEVLISAMRIHKYEYAGLNLATKLQGVDFRKLSSKSMRIMNRLTRVVAQYQDKYQHQASEGVNISIQQIVAAIFKGQVEFKTIPNESQPAHSVGEVQNGVPEGLMKIAYLPKYKFYGTLAKLKIKAGPKDIPNLNRFLCLDQQSPNELQIKKLVFVIEEFLRNHYLKSFGYTKRKFEDRERMADQIDEDGEEYYYEEEQQTAVIAAPVVNQNKQTFKANLPPVPATVQEEYEYYDEEEPPQKMSIATSVLEKNLNKATTSFSQSKLEKEKNDLNDKDDYQNRKLYQKAGQQLISQQEYGLASPNTIRNAKINNSFENVITEPNRFVTSQQDHYRQQSGIDSPEFKKEPTGSLVKMPSANLNLGGNYDARALTQNFGQGSDGYRGEPEGASKYQASNFKIEDLDDDEW